jgi:hypothetical protein
MNAVPKAHALGIKGKNNADFLYREIRVRAMLTSAKPRPRQVARAWVTNITFNETMHRKATLSLGNMGSPLGLLMLTE